MSKGSILVLSAILLVSLPTLVVASDQEVQGPLNELSIDAATPVIFNLAVSNGYAVPVYISYQRVLANHWVLSVIPGVFYVYDNWSGERYVATLWLELDWHPFHEGLQGFFLGPSVVAIYSKNSSSSSESGASAMVGATLGYQIFLPANLDLDIAAGLAFGSAPGSGSEMQGMPRVAIALGYRF